jgi:hypothetical protein
MKATDDAWCHHAQRLFCRLSTNFLSQPRSFIDHGRRGHPPFELLVPHEGPAPSCCRYICWRNCRTPSPEMVSPAGDHTSPLNGRAAPEMATNPRITSSSITGTAAIIPLAIGITNNTSSQSPDGHCSEVASCFDRDLIWFFVFCWRRWDENCMHRPCTYIGQGQ